MFGYKQTGREAVDAINVFHPAVSHSYDGYQKALYTAFPSQTPLLGLCWWFQLSFEFRDAVFKYY